METNSDTKPPKQGAVFSAAMSSLAAVCVVGLFLLILPPLVHTDELSGTLPAWLLAVLGSSEQSLLEANLSGVADRLFQFRLFTVFVSLPVMAIVTVIVARVAKHPERDEYSLARWLGLLALVVLYLGYACAFDNVLFRSGPGSTRTPADLGIFVGVGVGASGALLSFPLIIASIVRRARRHVVPPHDIRVQSQPEK